MTKENKSQFPVDEQSFYGIASSQELYSKAYEIRNEYLGGLIKQAYRSVAAKVRGVYDDVAGGSKAGA